MVFNSWEFLAFFPIVAIIYFVMPKKAKTVWLLIASYFFYVCWNPKYIVVLLFSTAVTYGAGLWLEYVDRSSAIDCSSPMSIIMFWKTPTVLLSPMGIDSPHCTMYCNSPTVFRHTDLPPALGPEMMRRRLSLTSMMSSGTTFLSCLASERCSSG